MKNILNIFGESVRTRKLYERLTNEQNKENSVKLGVRAIIYSLLLVVFGALFGLGFRLFSMVPNAEVGLILITILGGIVCIAVGIVGVLSNLIGALSAIRYQFRLNKKSIRIIALISFIICLLLMFIVCLISSGVIA